MGRSHLSCRAASALLLAALVAAISGCKSEPGASPPTDDAGARPPGAPKPGPATSVVTDDPAAAKDVLGDPLPRGAVARMGSLRMFDRHLERLIFTPSGKEMVSASYDRYVVWDAATGQRLVELERRDPGPALAVSPGGALLATSVAGSGEIQMWSLPKRQALRVLRHGAEVEGLCFLDEERLAVASDGVVAVLAVDGSGEKVSVKGDFPKLSAMACGGRQVVAVGDEGGGVFAVDLRKTPPSAARLGAAAKRVGALAVSPDGSHVAAGSDDAHAFYYDLSDPKKASSFEAHDRAVVSVAFSPDGKELWTSGGDVWFRAWNPEAGAVLREWTGTDGLTEQHMALSPDGKRAASWSVHRGAKGSEAGRFWLWNLGTGDPVAEPERHDEQVTAIAFSPDGAHIATASEDKTVRLWDAATGKPGPVLTAAQGPVNALEFSSDGSIVYSAGADAKLVAWTSRKDADLSALPPIGGKVNAFDVSGDGARVVTGDETGRVWTWDLKAKARLQALDRQTYSSITGVAFSPDGKLIAMTGSERVVIVIGADSGKEVARLSPDVVSNLAVTFSPKGEILATAGDDGAVHLWDTKTWKEARKLTGHDGSVRCLAFSPDGKRLASGSSDASARVWDAATGKEVTALVGHRGAVNALAFSPDGKLLATGSHDRTGLVWRLP
jgi:WD40 repeat protein